jgi:hypothetical protein
VVRRRLAPGIGAVVAVVGGAVAVVRVGSRSVKRRGALGQRGLRRLQRRLGLLRTRLGRAHPGVVQGQRGDPRTLCVLDDLLGQIGYPAPAPVSASLRAARKRKVIPRIPQVLWPGFMFSPN